MQLRLINIHPLSNPLILGQGRGWGEVPEPVPAQKAGIHPGLVALYTAGPYTYQALN